MATNTRSHVPKIIDLADRIEADISQRELRPGDRYLRTHEIAKMLGVDITMANRALQLLVKRKLLNRRPRLGTFIGGGKAPMIAGPSLERVHLLASDRQRAIEAMFESGELLGLQGALPGIKIQFEVVPTDDEDAYLQNVVADALKARDRPAFVLHVSTIAMQRVISASCLPAVVQGSIYPSITNLPSLNSDHQRAATLATEYVLRNGHRRICVMANRWQSPRGDSARMNAIFQTAHAAGLGINSLDVRFLPEDAAVGTALAKEILDASTEPLAVIAYSRVVADAVQEVVEARGLRLGEDVELVTLDHPILPSNRPDYPFIERTISNLEAGAMLGRMLQQVVQEGAAATPDEVIPVRLSVDGE